MNKSIQQLYDTASKEEKLIIGLMSGTSLDGLDLALCRISGSGTDTKVQLLEFDTCPYNLSAKKMIQDVTSVKQVDFEQLCIVHSWLGFLHADMILEMIEQWNYHPGQIDCIASHGQTVFHAPAFQHKKEGMPNATFQIGDGDHIAQKTGILTISDFRQKHTAAGGEGAPMVSYVDPLLFGSEDENRILLNIGGIANFTYLPKMTTDAQTGTLTTDTGPGNTMIDAAVKAYYPMKTYDVDGKLAASGDIHQPFLNELKKHPFFRRDIPKTTGPEVFNMKWVEEVRQKKSFEPLESADLIATLTRLTAETIAESIQEVIKDKGENRLLISGGGVHNQTLVKWIRELLPGVVVQNFKEIAFNPDAKEAVLFAVLANELLSGDGFSMNIQDGAEQKVHFGKISYPN